MTASSQPSRQIRTVWVPEITKWNGRTSGSALPLILMGIVLAVIVGVWLGSLAADLASPAVALFALSALATIGLALWMLIARFTMKQRQVAKFAITEPGVSFGAYAGRGAVRGLGIAGVAMLLSLVWLLVRGELYGSSPGSALFSGNGRLGAIIPAFIAVAIIFASFRAWTRPSDHWLLLSPEGVTLELPRTGGRVGWEEITGAQVSFDGVRIGGAGISWRVRDLDSDPGLLAALVAHLARRPSERSRFFAAPEEYLRAGSYVGE